MSPPYSAAEKQREAEREVASRKRIYGKMNRLRGGALDPADAKRIAIMQEIADDYRALANKERLA